jgi:cellulose synthase/poly-beta-1,6-N-acetylglucosamine synthase-like glycosyltransferase
MGISTTITFTLLFISIYFEVFLLMAFLQRRFGKFQSVPSPAESPLPSVAIVVPCFNESTTVRGTVNSLLALDYPANLLEILIVDDGSTDDTLQIVQDFRSDSRVRIFSKGNGGKHTAMNIGLENTQAEFIGCLDADSSVAPDALLKVMPVFNDSRVAAVTPCILVREPATLLQHMQNVEYRLSIFNRFILAAIGSAFITPGPFSFFRASVVRKLGGWRYAHSTEDMEMALRMQLDGWLIANAPSAIVHTSTPRTLRALFKQRVRWTYGWLRNAIDYRHMFGNGKYGNLSIIVLPSAIFSIFAGIYFFIRILYGVVKMMLSFIRRAEYGGMHMPSSFDFFYINTSAVLFVVYVSIAMILVLICLGSLIGTGSKKPPLSTPLFLIFYSFLVPLWLGAAVVRAIFKTGVSWR